MALGVSVWAPFVVLLLLGRDPAFFLFLPFHLAGIFTGVALRRGRRGPSPATRRIGNVLIMIGVAVWAPYFALDAMGRDPEAMYFLPFHLTGVVPGVFLRYFQELRRLRARLTGQSATQPNSP